MGKNPVNGAGSFSPATSALFAFIWSAIAPSARVIDMNIPLKVIVAGERTVIDFKPCPFCGSDLLQVTDYWWLMNSKVDSFPHLDMGDAIKCTSCMGSAPADKWNNRGDNNGS